MNNQNFFYPKDNFIKHMSKEKNMTVKEYNDKYITLIGECCALDKIGFISVEKNKLPTQACSYIEHLEQQCKKQKEVIDKIMNLIKQYGKYDGKKCTRGFQMWSADFNKILDILKEVSE